MLRVDDFLSSLLFLVCRPAGLLTGCHTSFLGVTRNFAVKIFPKQSAGCYRICCASIPARRGCFSAGMGTQQRHRLHRAHLRMAPRQTRPS